MTKKTECSFFIPFRSTTSPEPQSPELQSRQLQSPELQSRQLQSRQLRSRQLRSRQLQSRQLQSRQLQSLLMAAVVATLATGCGAEPVAPLVDLAAFELLDASHDPSPEGMQPSADCAFDGVQLEGGALEIDTGLCPYALVGWPLLRPLPAGAQLDVELSHAPLASLEGGTGHALLSLAGHTLLERHVPIPSPAAIHQDLSALPSDVPQGQLIVLHLHNHGANSWRLHLIEEQTP